MGDAKDEDLGASWDCLGSMVRDFKTKVRCKIREQCTPSELAVFVEDNFLSDPSDDATVSQKKVSTELQTQFMKIKKLFLGGNLEYITPEELDRLITLMSNLKGISKDINPSMKVLTLHWENKLMANDLSLFDFEAVNVNLVKLAQRLSEMINKEDNAYHFDDFHSLVKEMGNFVGNNWAWIDTVKSYLPLIKKLKKSINGGDEESLKDNEWNLFLLMGSRGYIQFLRYYYFIRDLDPEFTSLRLAYTARTIEEVFQILYDLLSFKESHQVSKAELEDLFKSFSNIWPVFKMSPTLMAEGMKLKQIFIGGTDLGFEKNDFLKAQKKVDLIKQIVEKFVPYYQFYGLSWHPELLKQADAYDYFNKATKNFTELTNKLTDEFSFESGYNLTSFISLMKEINRLYPDTAKESDFGQVISEYACVLQLGADILLDTQNKRLKSTCDQIELTKVDLTRLVKRSGEAFNIYLDYHYFVSRSRTIFNDLEFQIKFREFGNNVVNYLKNTITQRKSKRISTYELESLVSESVKLEILPKTIRKETANALIQTLLTKVLVPPEIKSQKVRYDGMEAFHAEQIFRELDNFLGISIFIHQTFENKNNRRFDYKTLLPVFKKSITDSKNPNFKLGMAEFVRNFETPHPLTITGDDKVFFLRNPNPIYGKKTLEKYNLNRFLAGILMRSYYTPVKNTVTNVLTDCDVKSAFADLKPILVDLDIISDAAGTGFIDARFIEANLFLTKSDGNDTVSFDELTELVNYIFSGFVIDGQAKKIIGRCASTKVGKDTLVDLVCLRNSYRNNVKSVLNSMPEYIQYTQKEPAADWEVGFLNNLKSAGYVPRQDWKVSLSDVSLFPHILQYSETIFMKFDINGDGFIDKQEGIGAYPYFAFLLKKVAKGQLADGTVKEAELEAMFTYILKYGKIPECNRSFVLLCLFEPSVRNWLDWKSNYKKDNYTLMANRTQISKILGIIADMVTTSPSVQAEAKTCNP